MKDPIATERRAADALKAFLSSIPQFELREMTSVGKLGEIDRGADIIAETEFAGRPLKLVVEIKTNGQPRMAHQAAYQLKRYLDQTGQEGVPMFIAPYLSEQAQAACREEDIAYLDFQGNARLVFDTIFIERKVEGKPEPERRSLRTLFKPKSARILRALLDEPQRPWRVTELSEAATVSLGLVSTIGTALREREWADQTEQGLRLVDPSGLLDEWVRNYEQPKGEEVRLYTHLHGKALAERLRDLAKEEGRVALASFSAADWYAPFVRQSTSYFYADEKGLGALQTILNLSAPAKGANVVVRVPDEDGVLDDARPVAPGVIVTGPVQTYLDLMAGGERGVEGAEHLKDKLLRWPA